MVRARGAACGACSCGVFGALPPALQLREHVLHGEAELWRLCLLQDATAQVNEVLRKALCHNLAVLVHAMHELGIEPTFGAEAAQ